MKRLYLKIYVALIGILVVFFILSAAFWWHSHDGPRSRELLRGGTAALELAFPPAGTPPTDDAERLARLAETLGMRLALFDAGGNRLAAAGGEIPAPDFERGESHWIRRRRHGAVAALLLSDGRWVVVGSPFSSVQPR